MEIEIIEKYRDWLFCTILPIKILISLIFHSYVSLPEGTPVDSFMIWSRFHRCFHRHRAGLVPLWRGHHWCEWVEGSVASVASVAVMVPDGTWYLPKKVAESQVKPYTIQCSRSWNSWAIIFQRIALSPGRVAYWNCQGSGCVCTQNYAMTSEATTHMMHMMYSLCVMYNIFIGIVSHHIPSSKST